MRRYTVGVQQQLVQIKVVLGHIAHSSDAAVASRKMARGVAGGEQSQWEKVKRKKSDAAEAAGPSMTLREFEAAKNAEKN